MHPGTITVIAAINGLVATGLSAVGAHALPSAMAAKDKAMFATATDFHLFHTLAMLGVAALCTVMGRLSSGASVVWLFQAGILAFCGSLYVRTVMGPGSLGAFHWITPMGGLLLMAGWVALVFFGMRMSRTPD